MSEPLIATAYVTTEAPERYAKQLASHLGRRCEIRDEPEGTRIVITGGDCLMQSRPGVLELHATADDAESLERVKDVVGRHLERFGQRHELQVSWS